MWLTSRDRGYDNIRVARWVNLDIGRKGVAFGGSMHDGENSGVPAQITIIQYFWSENSSWEDWDGRDSDFTNADENGGEQPQGGRRALDTPKHHVDKGQQYGTWSA